MGDEEARVLGAGDSMTINGKEYQFSPVNLKHLAEVQRAAVQYWKRNYLETYRENLDLIDRRERSEFMKQKLDEVARWSLEDLPTRKSYSANKVPINEELVALVKERVGEDVDIPLEDEEKWITVVEAVLDSEQITPAEVKELTGVEPLSSSISYDMWWVTGCFEGILCFLLQSLRIKQPGIKAEEVESWPMVDQMQASRLVEQVTKPDVKNT